MNPNYNFEQNDPRKQITGFKKKKYYKEEEKNLSIIKHKINVSITLNFNFLKKVLKIKG
jgi:hypothetical protein